MTQKIRTQEFAGSIVYSDGATVIRFCVGRAPVIVRYVEQSNETVIWAINAPERFGSWDTRKARLAYFKAFTAASVPV